MVDEKRILSKIAELNGYLKELSISMPKDFQKYMDDGEARRACERLLQISIECVIDISSLFVKDMNVGLPADEDGLFDKLKSGKIISAQTSETLKRMKSFRNILVHRYAEVDDEQVFHFLKNNISDFEKFKKEAIRHLK